MENELELAIEKVRKLIARANDEASSEAEVEMALKSANKLIKKYNIEASRLKNQIDEITSKQIWLKKIQHEKVDFIPEIGDVVGMLFGIKILWTTFGKYDVKLDIIGYSKDIDLFEPMFELILSKTRILYKKRYLEAKNSGRYKGCNKRFYKSYSDGFLLGMRNIIHELNQKDKEEQEYGLILYNKEALVEQYLEEKFSFKVKTAKKTIKEKEAFITGYQDGQNYNADNQIH